MRCLNHFKFNLLRIWFQGLVDLAFNAGIASAEHFYRHVSRQNSLTEAQRNISRHYDLVCIYDPTYCFLSHSEFMEEFFC